MNPTEEDSIREIIQEAELINSIFKDAHDLSETWPELSPEDRICKLQSIIARSVNLSPLERNRIKDFFAEKKICTKKDFDAEYREIKKARDGTSSGQELDELEEVRLIHAAIDFPQGSIITGLKYRKLIDGSLKDEVLYLYRDGQKWRCQVGGTSILIAGKRYAIDTKSSPPWLEDRWSLGELRAFIKNPEASEGKLLFGEIVSILKHYLDLANDGTYYLLAGWIVGTYLAHLFPAFPFLLFYGPKETGKSKTLEVLLWLCFNPVKNKCLSIAALGDTLDGMRGTLLVDQAEALPPDLVGYLADSYKKAGGRRRVVQIGKDGMRSTLEFNTYGPKAFASTKKLDPDLLDRCCRIPMVRTPSRLPDVEGWEDVWPMLRDELYRWIMLNYQTVSQRYSEIPSTGTRKGELWRPMGAVFRVLGVDTDLIAEAYEVFQKGLEETQYELTDWEEALFQAAMDLMQEHPDGEKVELDLNEILIRLQSLLDGDKPNSTKWVADQISKFSLGTKAGRRNIKGKKVTVYEFQRGNVQAMFERYLCTKVSENHVSTCPPDELSSYTNNLDWTHQKTLDTSIPVLSAPFDIMKGTI